MLVRLGIIVTFVYDCLVFPTAEEPTHTFHAGQKNNGNEERFKRISLLSLQQTSLQIVHHNTGQERRPFFDGTHELHFDEIVGCDLFRGSDWAPIDRFKVRWRYG